MSMIPLRARDGSIRAWTVVDDSDFAWLSEHRWWLDRHGYAYRTITRAAADAQGLPRGLLMHRVILGLKKNDGLEGDHVNGDRLDNRRSNLRACTHTQNQQNRHGGRGKSKYRGVCWHAHSGLWAARIMLDGRVHSLRYHKTEEAAAAAVEAFLSSGRRDP